MDPPLTRSPIDSFGYPTISLIHATVNSSNSVAAGPDRQHVTFTFMAAAIMLAAVATGAPGEDTYPKNRGCALCRLNPATSLSTVVIKSPKSQPCRGNVSPSRSRSPADVAGRTNG